MRRTDARRPFSPAALVLAAALGCTLLLGACGGGGGGSDKKTITASNGKASVEAHDIFFNVKQIDATPGQLDVTLEEKGSLDHTFVVQDSDGKDVGKKLAVSGGKGSQSGTFDLTPGTYTFFCDIPGHRGQGMEGKIVVK
jgi:nitrite reductase (NO-forming)